MTDTTDKALGQLEDERRSLLAIRLQRAHVLTRREDRGGMWVGTCACGGVFRNRSEKVVCREWAGHLTSLAERMIETRTTDSSVPGHPVTLPDATEILWERIAETVPNGTEGLPPEFCITLHHGREIAREVAATGVGQGYKTTGEIIPPSKATTLLMESPPCEAFARPEMRDVTPQTPSEEFASQRMNRLRKQLGTEAAPETMFPIAAALQELHDTHRALGKRLDERRRTDPRDQIGAAAIQGKMKGVGIAITLLQPHFRRERLRNSDAES